MAELAHREWELPMTVTQAAYDIAAIHAGIGDLAEWIGQHHNIAIGARSGADTAIECPHHRPGHTTSATVHRWPDGRQTFKCWRCDIGPVDVIDLQIELGNAASRGDSIRQLAELVGADKLDDYQPKKRCFRQPARKLVNPVDLDSGQVDDTRAGRDRVAAYCQWRGWSPKTAGYYQLQSVRRFDGWRIRHPFLNHRGQVVAAQDYKRSADQRWISAKGSNLTLFGQQNLTHIGRNPTVVDVCEGVSDCITLSSVFDCRWPVVGVPGSASWREQHSAALKRCQIIVWPDNDDAGTKFAESVIETHRRTQTASPIPVIGQVPAEYGDLTEWRQQASKFAGDFGVARHTAWKTRK